MPTLVSGEEEEEVEFCPGQVVVWAWCRKYAARWSDLQGTQANARPVCELRGDWSLKLLESEAWERGKGNRV